MIKGHIYKVSHTYGTNVAVYVSTNRFASVNHKSFEIVGDVNPSMNGLTIHSTLVYNNQVVSVRVRKGDKFYDVEIDALRGVDINKLKSYKIQTLKPYGDLLVTEEELKHNLSVQDMSGNKVFCDLVLKHLAADN